MFRLARVCSLLLLAVLVGCGSDKSSDDSSDEGAPKEEATSQGKATSKATAIPGEDSNGTSKLDITFKGDTVDPQGVVDLESHNLELLIAQLEVR